MFALLCPGPAPWTVRWKCKGRRGQQAENGSGVLLSILPLLKVELLSSIFCEKLLLAEP